MVERLKRWESPRKRGRNDKGKGGSARARQLRKREQMMRQKLKKSDQQKTQKPQGSKHREGNYSLSFFCSVEKSGSSEVLTISAHYSNEKTSKVYH